MTNEPTLPHACQCWRCTPEAYPTQPTEETIAYAAIQNEGQRPIPAWANEKRQEMAQCRVFLNDVECSNDGPLCVFEALAGNPGWVIGYECRTGLARFHYCGRCIANPDQPVTECTQVLHGEVSVEWVNG